MFCVLTSVNLFLPYPVLVFEGRGLWGIHVNMCKSTLFFDHFIIILCVDVIVFIHSFVDKYFKNFPYYKQYCIKSLCFHPSLYPGQICRKKLLQPRARNVIDTTILLFRLMVDFKVMSNNFNFTLLSLPLPLTLACLHLVLSSF